MYKITPSRLFYYQKNEKLDFDKIENLVFSGQITNQEANEMTASIIHQNALQIESNVKKAKETRKKNKLIGTTATRRTLNKVDDASAIIAAQWHKKGLRPFFITLTTPVRNKNQTLFKKAVSAFLDHIIKLGYFERNYILVYELQDGQKSAVATNEIHSHILINSMYDKLPNEIFVHTLEIWRKKLRLIYNTSKTVNGKESSSCHIEKCETIEALLGYFKKQKVTNDLKKSAKKIGINGRNYAFSQSMTQNIEDNTMIISHADTSEILSNKNNIIQISCFVDKYENKYLKYKHNLILQDRFFNIK